MRLHSSLTWKIIWALLAVSLPPLLLMQWWNLRAFEVELLRTTQLGLASIAEKKAGEIGTYVAQRLSDLELLARNPALARDMSTMQNAFGAGVQSAAYEAAEARLRPFYAAFAERGGYYDLFFVTPAGDVVFTVAREADLATNLHHGAYRDTELGRAVRRAQETLDSAFSDVAYYEPSKKPAVFSATPVIAEGALIGVLAMQIDQDHFAKVVQNRTGLGKTGETVVAQRRGNDAMIVFSRVHPQPHAVTMGARRATAAKLAILGGTGTGSFVDYRGRPVVAAWRYIPEARAGMVVKVDLDEALGPVAAMRTRLIATSAALAFGVILLGVFLGRRLAGPLRVLNAASQQMAGGRLDQNIVISRSDEIAELSRSFNLMAEAIRRAHETLEERVRSRTAELQASNQALAESEDFVRSVLDTVLSSVVSIDEAGVILSVNHATETMFGYAASELIGHKVNLLMPEPHRAEHDAYLAHYLEGGEPKIIGVGREVQGVRKNGEAFPLEVGVSEVRREDGQRIFVGVLTEITARKRAEDHLRASLRERELLLKEIYHRVKNNLQVVSSLLHLQVRRSTDEAVRKVLADSARRIKSMALVHEQLYARGDLSSIDFGAYVDQLLTHLRESFRETREVTIVARVESVPLGIETAVPLGLIVNELVTNAIKHAFGPEGRGRIEVGLRRVDADSLEVWVADDGVGLPAGFDPSASATLGIQLVTSLTRQLDGVLEWGPDGALGTRFQIRFRPDAPQSPESPGSPV